MGPYRSLLALPLLFNYFRCNAATSQRPMESSLQIKGVFRSGMSSMPHDGRSNDSTLETARALSLLLLRQRPGAAFNPHPPGRHHSPRLVKPRCRSEAIHCSQGGGIGALLERQWTRYNNANNEHPWATKMATSAFLASVGDVTAQYLEGASSLAVKRLLSLATVNVIYIVPLLSFFYALNERLCTKVVGSERGTWRSTGVMLIFDQCFIAPIALFGFFWVYGFVTCLFGVPGAPALGALYSTTAAGFKTKFVTALVTNWKVWVLPQILNFAAVPPKFRVSFANCVSLVWNIILSIIANKK